MFRSVFVKYISAFMLINIISILLSTTIITTLVNIYDENNKTRTLGNIVYTVSDYIVTDYWSSGKTSFSDYLNNSVVLLKPVLDAMVASVDDVVLFISDGEGAVKLVGGSEKSRDYTGEDGIIDEGDDVRYPDGIVEQLEKLTGSEKISVNSTLDGFFEEKHRICIRPIFAVDGRLVGSVMATTSNTDMDELLESMIRTMVMSSLWLMLAALIAVYFITERLVSPLRSMSMAAREFAGGNFDVRVPENGNDEVAELAVAFNNMASTLQHSEDTRRLFLANISHDLRTPMTTISGFIDMILQGTIPKEKVPHYLEVIRSEILRLSRLVSSLLDLTKIEAGERKFNKVPMDICEMGRQIIIASEKRLEEKQLDVQFDADRDNMYVNADVDAIHQVLYNLCDNAIKFSKPGGKYILSIHETGGKITVSVFNEGDGISPEDLPYVFDRFYKSDKSRGLDKTGTGLGLYISRIIIEAHDEQIRVESEYGQWCRFSFSLPKASAPRTKGGEGES
ncbi:MAG: HAMP domain-containing histidine kinase [Ruminococcaceae bacterium]|nr:HAMP domain-containing histidine kinase [Oscillospiraceae bacterium]